jgi:hypothetical protein
MSNPDSAPAPEVPPNIYSLPKAVGYTATAGLLITELVAPDFIDKSMPLVERLIENPVVAAIGTALFSFLAIGQWAGLYNRHSA